jgi:hypothetical protein
MNRKKRNSGEGFTFFRPPGPDDPIGSFAALLANKFANYGLQVIGNKLRE